MSAGTTTKGAATSRVAARQLTASRATASRAGWIRRVLPFAAPHARGIAAVVTLTLTTAAIDAVEPLLVKFLIDALGTSDALRSLSIAAAALVGLGVLRQAIGWVQHWLGWRVRLGVHYSLQRAFVARVLELPLAFFRREGVNGITSKMDRGVNGVVGAFDTLITQLLPNVAYLAFSLTAMFVLDWRLLLVALVVGPLPALIGVWAATEQVARERRLFTQWTRIYARFHETLSAIATVRSAGYEGAERRRFMRLVREANRVVIGGVRRDAAINAASSLAVTVGRIATVVVGGYLVVRGETTVGTVVACLGYVGGVFGPLQGLTGAYQTVRRASVCLEPVVEILDADNPLRDAPDARVVDRVHGEIHFDRVTFSYDGGRPAVRDIDLHVRPGETIALVGPSGAGKTTLVSLLQRLDDPTAGAIRLDGMDLRSIRTSSLRRHVAVVLQDGMMFDCTVRDNIAYGCARVTAADVERAARAANAHDFILALDDGYDTIVGERGTRLSAGQRQRLALARALLRDAPVLILDEATSALDAESEWLVREALDRLTRGRTTIIVAHRLTTAASADRVVVLRHGVVTEVGPHDALVRAGGYYASLVERQTIGSHPGERRRGTQEAPDDAAVHAACATGDGA
jgi:ATP-binding cassette subfamily B protein